MRIIKNCKELKKDIKTGIYKEASLERLKEVIDYYLMEIIKYEEEMTFKEADVCWGAYDSLVKYTREKFPEYDKEMKEKEQKEKEEEERLIKEGKIIVFDLKDFNY